LARAQAQESSLSFDTRAYIGWAKQRKLEFSVKFPLTNEI